MRRTRPRLTALAALALAVALTACASSSAGGASGRSRDTAISAEELEKWSNEDLFTLIQRIRPTWLQSRAIHTGMGRQEISVILDGMLQRSGFDLLRGLLANDVREVSYMNARDATTLYGTGMSAGAIVILTKR